MKKEIIKNRKNKDIVILINKKQNSQGLVFIMHGLGGFKEQKHIQSFAKTFEKKNFTTILFDTTNTLGESEGEYENATTTNYFEDLEDVVMWSSNQNWYKEPFWLVGHSLGGISTILFAEKYPQKVKALAPISTVVSGKMSLETSRYKGNNILKKWKENGYIITKSTSKPGILKKLKWSHIEDRLKYNILNNVNKLTMPVILIVGEKDDTTPPEHQQILFDKLPGKKEIHIIKNALHTFKEEKHLKEIEKILDSWINKIDN